MMKQTISALQTCSPSSRSRNTEATLSLEEMLFDFGISWECPSWNPYTEFRWTIKCMLYPDSGISMDEEIVLGDMIWSYNKAEL